MTTWYQACRLDGKIRSCEAVRETTKTITFVSPLQQREVTIHKVREGMFCSKSWSVAHGWLMQTTRLEVIEARGAFNAAVMHKADEDVIDSCRHRLNKAKSIHGNVKGMKAPT